MRHRTRLSGLEGQHGPSRKMYYCINGETGEPLDKHAAAVKADIEKRLASGENIQAFEIAMREDS